MSELIAMVHLDRRSKYALQCAGDTHEGVAARVQAPGDPLRYPTGPEYRDLEGLRQLCEQLPGKPLTLLHPDGLIRDGAQARVVGKVVSAHIDGDYAHVTVQIDDPDAQAAVADGTKGLSVGYACDVDGARYQRNIHVDHLAIVPVPRCGPACRLDHNTDEDDHHDEGGSCECGCAGTCKSRAMPHNHDMDEGSTPTQTPGSGTPVLDKDLSAKDRHAIPAGHFGIPSREGLPLNDANHVRDAMARFNQTHFANAAEKRAAHHRIIARAHDLGIDPSGFQKGHGHADDEGYSMDNADAAMKDLQDKCDALTKERDELKSRADKAEQERADARQATMDAEARVAAMAGERDSAKKDAETATARADAAEQAVKSAGDQARLDAESNINARVIARAQLFAQADKVLGTVDTEGKPVDRTALTDRDIKVAIVKHVDGDDIAPEQLDAYVEGMFTGALKRHAKAVGSVTGFRQAVVQMRQDGQAPAISGAEAEKAAQSQMSARVRAAWMNPSK